MTRKAKWIWAAVICIAITSVPTFFITQRFGFVAGLLWLVVAAIVNHVASQAATARWYPWS